MEDILNNCFNTVLLNKFSDFFVGKAAFYILYWSALHDSAM
jgi:hypothetical protein